MHSSFHFAFASLLACCVCGATAQEKWPSGGPLPRAPANSTASTRADSARLAELEKPGELLFSDDFESAASLEKYFEIRGRDEGRAKLVEDVELAHRGRGAMQFDAPANDGKSSGSGASGWLGAKGHERVHFRRYIRFDADYDQGNLNHTGGGLTAVTGNDKWRAMGSAGIKPSGDDHFSCAFEPWCDWGRVAKPGYLFFYVYWMDMERDRDGHFWGNMLGPEVAERFVPERGRWYCLEQMVKANSPGKADGELAAWIDGKLYLHYTGLRLRSDAAVLVKRFDFGIYVHQATRSNRVWYDDVALSTGYIGPIAD
jgi:hypothetical protein